MPVIKKPLNAAKLFGGQAVILLGAQPARSEDRRGESCSNVNDQVWGVPRSAAVEVKEVDPTFRAWVKSWVRKWRNS